MRVLLVGVLFLTGCPGFTQTQQAWLAYRHSPAYYETTYYSSSRTSAGSIYCTTTCGPSGCRQTCEVY